MVAEFVLPSLLQESFHSSDSNSKCDPKLVSTLTATTTEGEAIGTIVHITPLLLLARELGFTNEGMKRIFCIRQNLLVNYLLLGEIFSSMNLAVLAERHYGLRVEVLRPFSSRDVIRHLLLGHPLLIPYPSSLLPPCTPTSSISFTRTRYDADKNFAPCITSGKHPHWAVVRGFVYKIPDTESESPVHSHFSTPETFVELDADRPIWFYTTKPFHDILHHLFLVSLLPF
jgi:hypothetical protein